MLDIAGGRVWLGKDALEVGLIDTYGGLKTAIALAVDKAELGDGYRVVEVKEEPTGFAAIIASLNVSVQRGFRPFGTGTDDEGVQHRARGPEPAGRPDVLALEGRSALIRTYREKEASPDEGGASFQFVVSGVSGEVLNRLR